MKNTTKEWIEKNYGKLWLIATIVVLGVILIFGNKMLGIDKAFQIGQTKKRELCLSQKSHRPGLDSCHQTGHHQGSLGGGKIVARKKHIFLFYIIVLYRL